MKKRLIGITLAAVMAFSLAACGGSSSSSSASGSGSASASNSTASGDSIVLTLNHDGATDHPYNYGCEKFADLVKEKTNGDRNENGDGKDCGTHECHAREENTFAGKFR